MRYRPEIDGLRAIAVVSVILYHAEILYFGRDWFHGGFVGVDVFFVISGYLISKIIFLELENTSRFNLLNFYERRARRILPMLFTIMLASLPIAWLFLLPRPLIEYAQSMLSSVFFGSNVFFTLATAEYGAEPSLLKPLLHTWSLSVEEQFYVVFPLLAVLIHKTLKRHEITVFLIAAILSLQLSEVYVEKDAIANFYLPFSRAWELLFGVLISAIELRYRPRFHDIFHQVMPVVGLSLIVHSVVFFSNTMPHPSFLTLLPVCGTAFIILFSNGADLVGRILSTRIFIYVGLISYSLYLWHFPIFSFASIRFDSIGSETKLLLIALTFVLSALSHRFIEQRFRKQFSTRTFFVATITAASIIIASSLFIMLANGVSSRFPPILHLNESGKYPWQSIVGAGGKVCHDNQIGCEFRTDNATAKVALIGDSDVPSIAAALHPMLKDKFDILYFSQGTCPVYLNAQRHTADGKPVGCSASFQKRRLDTVRSFEPDLIIHIGRYFTVAKASDIFGELNGNKITSDEAILSGVDEMTKIAPLIIVDSPPGAFMNVAKHIKKRFDVSKNTIEFEKSLIENPIVVPYEKARQPFRDWESLKTAELQHIKFFDTFDYFCDDPHNGEIICRTHNARDIFYHFDARHPSYAGASLFAQDLAIEIERSVNAP